jgi:hypothetical protein
MTGFATVRVAAIQATPVILDAEDCVAKAERLHRDWVEYFERHRDDGGVSVPRPYLLVIGRRRTPHTDALMD